MNIIIIGPQGSGKGTQAKKLAPKISAVKLSTGDLFRAEIAAKTPLGIEVEGILKDGGLVSDEITLGLVDRELDTIAASGAHGAIFDGFPRTTAQAEGLDDLLTRRNQTIDRVIELAVPEHVLIERMSNRRVCSVCQKDQAVTAPDTEAAERCSQCGGTLVRRPDDQPHAIRERLRIYNESTKPLLDFYGRRGLVSTIDGNQDVESVQKAIIDALAATPVDSEA